MLVTGRNLSSNVVDELYSTMSPELRKLAYDQGCVEQLTTEAQIMERIRSLAVSVLHTAVHTVTLSTGGRASTRRTCEDH